MRMVGCLQWVTHTQSSQYVLNEVNWVRNDLFLQTFSCNSRRWTWHLSFDDFSVQSNSKCQHQHKDFGRKD